MAVIYVKKLSEFVSSRNLGVFEGADYKSVIKNGENNMADPIWRYFS